MSRKCSSQTKTAKGKPPPAKKETKGCAWLANSVNMAREDAMVFKHELHDLLGKQFVRHNIDIKILCGNLSHVYSIYILWISAQRDFSIRWGNSVKTCRLPPPLAAHRSFPSGSATHWSFPHWVRTLGPPGCMEPNVGSMTAQQSSGLCPAPISPQNRHKRCPSVTLVCWTCNNVKIEHGYPHYCLLLLIIDLPDNAATDTVCLCVFAYIFVHRSIIRINM